MPYMPGNVFKPKPSFLDRLEAFGERLAARYQSSLETARRLDGSVTTAIQSMNDRIEAARREVERDVREARPPQSIPWAPIAVGAVLLIVLLKRR